MVSRVRQGAVQLALKSGLGRKVSTNGRPLRLMIVATKAKRQVEEFLRPAEGGSFTETQGSGVDELITSVSLSGIR